MPSFPSTLATPFIIWTESNCHAMLFLMDQNVLRKGTFEIFPELLICVQKNRFLKALNFDMSSFKLQLLFCVFSIGQQRFSFDSPRNGQGIQANVYKREHCIMRQHDVPDFVPSPFVSRFAKTTCNLELKKPRKAFLSASPISTARLYY